MTHAKKSLLRWLWEEFLRILPAIIYFAISFNLVQFTIGLALAPGQHHYFTSLELILIALIIGKALLITDSMPFINFFPHRPLIYNILWKFVIYLFFIFLLWGLEALIDITYSFDSFYAGWTDLTDSLYSPVFLACLLWISYTLLVYVVISEYIRVLGKERILQILLRRRLD